MLDNEYYRETPSTRIIKRKPFVFELEKIRNNMKNHQMNYKYMFKVNANTKKLVNI